ncbi:uncharacterized protein FIBRA_06463 [Fibroporia radiculosa]|uniref:Uncharacterized protein n=1 Tax=Fibroporia radiculosa TaxID=599839 RepID=J4HZ54_9APHY|nr:uncharacterized protein FIBRA_06463 [Fibroporia radiculosa]CCM04292.1 predicted protein [Fibroporia radiculosa]
MSTIRTMVWTPVSIGYDNVTPWLVARGCRPRNMTLVFSPWHWNFDTSIHETLIAAGTALDHLSLFIYDFCKITPEFSRIPANPKISTLCIRLVNSDSSIGYSRVAPFVNLPALCEVLQSIGTKHTKLQQLLLGFELDQPCLDTDWSETDALLARILIFRPHLAVTIRVSPHSKRNDGHEWMGSFVRAMLDGLSRSLATAGRVTLVWAFHRSQLLDS